MPFYLFLYAVNLIQLSRKPRKINEKLNYPKRLHKTDSRALMILNCSNFKSRGLLINPEQDLVPYRPSNHEVLAWMHFCLHKTFIFKAPFRWERQSLIAGFYNNKNEYSANGIRDSLSHNQLNVSIPDLYHFLHDWTTRNPTPAA